MKIKKPEMMKKSEIANENVSSFGLQILCFFAVFIITSMIEAIPLMVLMFKDIFKAGPVTEEVIKNITSKYQTPTGNVAIMMLFLTVFSIIIPIIYCKFIEKRPISSMGIVKKRAIRNYLFGLAIGFIMFSTVVLLNIGLGGMEFKGINSNIVIGYLIIYLIGYGIQGMSEEILCRGYLMNSIGGKHSILLAVITSSVIFAMLHLLNPGITILAFINLFLFGAFAAIYIICFDNIWGASAIHTIWNFAQGIVYGISVSGAYTEENSILAFKNIEGRSFINGGAFGAEGGIAVTIVLLTGILIVLGYMWSKKKIEVKKINNEEN